MDNRADRECLYQAGLTRQEIARLSQVRRDYLQKKFLAGLTELRRLEFVRWLVATGRLTEEKGF